MDRGYLATEYPSQYSDFHVPLYELNSRTFYVDGNNSEIESPYMHSTPIASATPPMANINDNISRTRTGRPIRSESPHGGNNTTLNSALRSTSPKRNRRARSGKSKKDNVPHLNGPLSIITKDMTVPIRDMEVWVNRSIDVRRQEAERRKGYVTRPMNSFMLYRSAYAERTKAWCTENNHQIVSSVSGASWPMEPPEVRDFYNELAKIERVNHQSAHPEYKFSPAKPANKRKNVGEENEGINSDNDPDGDWAATHRVRGGRTRAGRDASYPSRSSESVEQRQIQPSYTSAATSFANAPEWSMNAMSSVRTLPSQANSIPSIYQGHYPHSQSLMGSTYYGNILSPHNLSQSILSDFRYPNHSSFSSRVGTPSISSNVLPQTFDTRSNGFVGLPGAASHHNLLSLSGNTQRLDSSQQTSSIEDPIDPSLLPFDTNGVSNSFAGDVYDAVYGYGGIQQTVETNTSHNGGYGVSATQSHQSVQAQQYLDQDTDQEREKYQPKEWEPDNNDEVSGTDATCEFDAYWASHTTAVENVALDLGLGVEDTSSQNQTIVYSQENSKSVKEYEEDGKRKLMELFGEKGERFSLSEGKPNCLKELEEEKSPKRLEELI